MKKILFTLSILIGLTGFIPVKSYSMIQETANSLTVNPCSTAFDYGDVDDPYVYGSCGYYSEVWYSFDVPANNTDDVVISLCYSLFDTQVAVFDDCSDYSSLPSAGMPTGAIAYNDDYCGYQSLTTLSAPAAGTYYVVMWGYEFEGGSYDLEIYSSSGSTTSCTADADFSYSNSGYDYTFTNYVQNTSAGYWVDWDFDDGTYAYDYDQITHTFGAPGTYDVSCAAYDPNDANCYDEVTYTITVSAPAFSNSCATAFDYGDVDDPYVYGSVGYYDAVWYSFDVPANNTDDVVISLCYSLFDTQVAVFEDCSDYSSLPSAGMPAGAIAYNDDYCGYQSLTTLSAPAAGTYYVVMWGYYFEGGSYDLEIYSSSGSTTSCTADADFSYTNSGYDYTFTNYVQNTSAGYWVDWDFDDGTYAYDYDQITHTFGAPGTYDVSCAAYDPNDANCYDEVTYTITVSAPAFSNSCATAFDYGDVDDPYVYGSVGYYDAVWYSFDVPANNTDDVVISLCYSLFDTQVAVFDDCSDYSSLPSAGMPAGAIAYNDDYCGYQSLTTLSAPAAGTYYVVMWGYYFEGGSYDLEIYSSSGSTTSCTADADFSYTNSGYDYTFTNYVQNTSAGYWVDWDFDDGTYAYDYDQITHTFGAPGTYDVSCVAYDPNDASCYDEVTYTITVSAPAFSNSCATAFDYGDVDDPYVYGSVGYYDAVWYSFDVPANNTDDVVISLCNSLFDTQVAVFEDCSDYSSLPSAGMPTGAIAYNDDYCGYQSLTTLSAPAAGTYYVVMWGYYFEGGSYDLEIYSSSGSTTSCTVDAEFTASDNGDLSADFNLVNTYSTSDYSISWDFGDNDTGSGNSPTHTYAGIGNYTVSCLVEDLNDATCWDEYTTTLTVTNSSAPWSVTITGTNHTILIPTTSSILIDGNALSNGSYLGVFYDVNGTLVCGGFTEYNSSNGNMFISAWGEDAGDDGFAVGEEFTWKIYDATSSTEYQATPVYDASSFPNTAYFAVNGMSGLLSLTVDLTQTQDIILYQGWNIMSTYIDPDDPSCVSVFSSIVTDVVIVKDYAGMIYWPEWSINAIGNLDIGEGYQVKMYQTQTLTVTGSAITPELTPISIPQGWSIIGYLRQSPASIVTMLSGIVSNIEIVKDEAGMIYWPAWSINAIGDMEPGEGYQIKTTVAVQLSYPANSVAVSKAMIPYQPLGKKWNCKLNTGSNMTLGIPEASWEFIPKVGSEVGVFDQNGNLVGSQVYTGGNLAITIWGQDFTSAKPMALENEAPFTLKWWNPANDETEDLLVREWIQGDNAYSENAIAIAGKVSSVSNQIAEIKLSTYPNPAKNMLNIGLDMPSSSEVELGIFSLQGQKIMAIKEGLLKKGNQSIQVSLETLSAGLYYVQLRSSLKNLTVPFEVIK